MNEWKKVEDQRGIDELMETFMGFHDSCIHSLRYESGCYVDEERSMYAHVPPEKFVLYIVFHSQWEARAVELRFEGVRRFHIVGLEDNYMKDIYDAYLDFHEGILPAEHDASPRTVVWADYAGFKVDRIGDPLEEPGTSYVIATTLQWRIVEK